MVAVAAVVVTSGAALAALSPQVVTIGQGIATVLGTTGAVEGVSAGLVAGAGVIGGVVGDAAAQGFGIATGLQSGFDWAGVALAGIGAAVEGGLGLAFKGGVLGAAARGLAGSAIGQGIGVATGLQSKFDFAGVAAAGLGAGVAQSIHFGGFSGRLLRSTVSDLTNAAARSLLDGSDFGDNVLAALPDVIGQTVGSLLAGRIAASTAPVGDGRQPAIAAAGLSIDVRNVGPNGSSLSIPGIPGDGDYFPDVTAALVNDGTQGQVSSPTDTVPPINNPSTVDAQGDIVVTANPVDHWAVLAITGTEFGGIERNARLNGEDASQEYADIRQQAFKDVSVVNLRPGISMAADVLPVASTSKFVYQAATGIDPITGKPVNQLISAAAAGLSVLPFAGAAVGRFTALGAVSEAAETALPAIGGRVPNAGGVTREFSQSADQVYYRVFTDNTTGRFLTAVPPRSSAFAREALALPPENLATFIQEVRVPGGTSLLRSRAIPAFGGRGGAEQFELLNRIPNENFGLGRPLP